MPATTVASDDTANVDPMNVPAKIDVEQKKDIATSMRSTEAGSVDETDLSHDKRAVSVIKLGQMLERSYNRRMPIAANPPGAERFSVIQKWEGYVLEVMEDAFWARLHTLVGEAEDLDAEILLNAVDRDDLSLVEPGAVFYWSIGYRDDENAQRTQASSIRFRRLPAWSSVDQIRADAIEEKLKHLFDEQH
jgi:hypothetical protein